MKQDNTDRYLSWSTLALEQGLPGAVVDRDALRANVETLYRLAQGKPIRVVTKSVRCPALLRWIMDTLGTHCAGLMAYHPNEAALLAEQFPEARILVAYPNTDPLHLARVCAAIGKGADITLMVDDHAQLMPLEKAARNASVRVPVCLDLDLSSRWPGLHFGVHRSPLRTVDQVVSLAKKVAESSCFRFWGLMGYEAQIAGVPDRLPGDRLHSGVVPWLKAASRRHVKRFRAEVVLALSQAGMAPSGVNGGGTGSVAFTAGCPEVTEVAVGSGFFAPHLFDGYSGLDLAPAAGFVCRVERRSDARHVTVGGGGYVASGAPHASRLPVPVWPNGLALDSLEGAGEVQTPLIGRGVASLRVGDAVVFRHAKAGELCERFDRLICIESGAVVASVPTYRGLNWQFL